MCIFARFCALGQRKRRIIYDHLDWHATAFLAQTQAIPAKMADGGGGVSSL